MTFYNEQTANNRKRGNFTLEITTTALCDLGCTYCFEGEKTDKRRLDGDLETIFKRVDSILTDETWFHKNYDSLNITFWGGEPTLNPKFIVDIMNRYANNDLIEFHIYTNAFNINNLNQIIDNVSTKKLRVQVSYDGKEVNDAYRLTKNKKATSNQVLNNLYILAQKGIDVSIKSTLPIENMETLYNSWVEFRDIQDMLWRVDKRLNINYAPTIDYVTKIADDQKDESVKVFRKQFLAIAKQEIEFYKAHGRYLCSWFGGEDTRKHCSAGYNMAAIDQAGSLYACHGAIYSSKKNDLISTTIHDDDFIEKLSAYTQKFAEPLKKIAKPCQDCVATTCMICPVISHEKSDKEDFFDKWTDNWVNNLCGFFKTFGEIDRAVQEYMFREVQIKARPGMEMQKGEGVKHGV